MQVIVVVKKVVQICVCVCVCQILLLFCRVRAQQFFSLAQQKYTFLLAIAPISLNKLIFSCSYYFGFHCTAVRSHFSNEFCRLLFSTFLLPAICCEQISNLLLKNFSISEVFLSCIFCICYLFALDVDLNGYTRDTKILVCEF